VQCDEKGNLNQCTAIKEDINLIEKRQEVKQYGSMKGSAMTEQQE
jgi:hypothetical protein